MTTTALRRKVEYISPTRQRVMGILFLAIALSIWVLFSRPVSPEIETVFVLTPGRFDVTLPDWHLPTQATLNVIAFGCAFLGAAQLARARGFGRRTNMVLALVAGLFIFAFLTWAAAGRDLNLAGLLNTTISKAVPITLGALSGILCERAGVVNIAIEGMMLSGAMMASLIGSVSNSLWIGLLSAILIGGFLGFIHAVLSIKYLVNQIVSGTVINIFSIGITSYISSKFLQRYQELNSPGIFPNVRIPLLADIPFFGPILFNNNIFIYTMLVFLIVLHIALYYTRWGLRVRSVGEHPRAADTLGINVFRTRYMSVILGGMMAGFGGAYFTLGSVGRFNEVMTAGRGFIGLAAMIFGNWNPFGALGAGLLFGFADSLASRLAILSVQIPSHFLLMAPYVATMIVLAGVVGRGQMPAADGVPYEKE
jgi:general nucleoside transport system permease protein